MGDCCVDDTRKAYPYAHKDGQLVVNHIVREHSRRANMVTFLDLIETEKNKTSYQLSRERKNRCWMLNADKYNAKRRESNRRQRAIESIKKKSRPVIPNTLPNNLFTYVSLLERACHRHCEFFDNVKRLLDARVYGMNYVLKMKEYYFYLVEEIEVGGICNGLKALVKKMLQYLLQIDSLHDLEASVEAYENVHKQNQKQHDIILAEFLVAYEKSERHPSQYQIDAETKLLYDNKAHE